MKLAIKRIIQKEAVMGDFKKGTSPEWVQRANGIKARVEKEIINQLLQKFISRLSQPDDNLFWKQSVGNENSYLFVTTRHLNGTYLDSIIEDIRFYYV